MYIHNVQYLSVDKGHSLEDSSRLERQLRIWSLVLGNEPRRDARSDPGPKSRILFLKRSFPRRSQATESTISIPWSQIADVQTIYEAETMSPTNIVFQEMTFDEEMLIGLQKDVTTKKKALHKTELGKAYRKLLKEKIKQQRRLGQTDNLGSLEDELDAWEACLFPERDECYPKCPLCHWLPIGDEGALC